MPPRVERFGKYHVLSRIAQGGMAEVYKVKTMGIAGFEKVQALKRILPNLARDDRFIQSFVDEARIAVELNHRNIVQVFDFDKSGNELFLAMELIDGTDLRTAVEDADKRGVPLPLALACYVVGEVAAGLDYAHRKCDSYGNPLGIVHCDISPQNIMLSYEGYVKILDFGVARARISSRKWTRRLRGKPRYMAPEQTRGEPPTPATDVFSLGIVAWELLTGLPLFEGSDLKAVLGAVRRANTPAADKINPEVPAPVAAAVARALSRDPEDRGTAGELGLAMSSAAQRVSSQASARALAQWLGEVYPRTTPERAALPLSPPAEGSQDDAGGAGAQEASHLSISADAPAPLPGVLARRSPAQPTRPLPAVGAQVSLRSVSRDFGAGATWALADDEPDDTELADDDRDTELADDDDDTALFGVAPDDTELVPSDRDDTARVATGPGDDTARVRAPGDDTAHIVTGAASGPDPDSEPAPDRGAAPPGHTGNTGWPELLTFGGTTTTTVGVEDDLDEGLGEPSPLRLLEKRRVVAAVVLVDGGTAEARRELTGLLADLAYKRGAVLHSQDDDSLVAVFGLEVAGEDDVARAMGYALDAVEAAREASVSAGGDLSMRIAARAGTVAAPDDRGGYRLVGDAVEETRELARGAEPGKPLLSGGAGRLTSAYYAFRELPARRHRRRRLGVLELLGPRSFDERERALHTRRGRFFGRLRELAQLSQALDQAMAARRRVLVALEGPPGVGKSRLLAEFVARARATVRDPRPRVIAVAATPGSKATPFGLTIELIQAVLNLPPGRGEAARSRLTQRMRHILSSSGLDAEVRDELVGATEMAMELRDGALITPLHKSADLRERVIGALHGLRTVLMPAHSPLITILEDLHFADTTSIEVLRESIPAWTEMPELVVVTMSADSGHAAALSEWVDEVIALGELAGDELSDLIADRLGDSSTGARVAAISQRAGGNPLLVEQLAMEARDGGEIPPTARALITARVDRLSSPAKAVLQHAAVAGPRFRARILEELVGREIAEELGELCDEALLERLDDAPAVAQEGELAFTAELIREVVYDSLSSTARRDTHASLGQLLAARHRAGRDEPPATIAEHLELGGHLSQASAYWLRAGLVALAAGDASAAAKRFGRTLAIEDAGDDSERSRASRIRLREALAGRERACGQLGDHRAQARDLERLQALAATDPQIRASVESRVALFRLRLGELDAAAEASQRAEDAAREHGDERGLGEALRIRGEIYEHMGELERALDMNRKAQELFRRIGAVDEETEALIGIGRTHVTRARYQEALAEYGPIMERLQNSGNPWLERVVRNHMATIHWCLGEHDKAMESAKRAVELCQRYGDRAREGDCLAVCGAIWLEIGRYHDARVHFSRALAILERTGSRWSRADCLVYAGLTETRLGHHERSVAYLREASHLARDIGARYVRVNALVALAAAMLARDHQGDVAIARKAAAKAVDEARATALVGGEIQGLSRLAEATWRAGDVDQAVALSAEAVALLDEQRHIEGSEQEIFFTHYRLLRAAGADGADRVLARARAEVERKLEAMSDPEWRRAFTREVAVNAAILEASGEASGGLRR